MSNSVTILICVHSPDVEHDRLFQRALESLVRQTYDNFKVVIILDECWEQTQSIVDSYSDVLDIKSYSRPKKKGLADAKNFGVSKCDTEWIAYLDADDQWIDCKLEVQLQWANNNPNVSFIGTNAWDLIDDRMYVNCFSVLSYQTHNEISDALKRENVLCHGSMMIRRCALDQLGGYNTDKYWLGREDWELWSRAVASGYLFNKIPERLYIYSMGTSVPR